jgi:hypothetical protein
MLFAETPAFPWSELLSSGSAGIAIILSIIWLRHVSEMRSANAAHVENVTKTVEVVAKTFADASEKNTLSSERTAKSFEEAALTLHQQTNSLVRDLLIKEK